MSGDLIVIVQRSVIVSIFLVFNLYSYLILSDSDMTSSYQSISNLYSYLILSDSDMTSSYQSISNLYSYLIFFGCEYDFSLIHIIFASIYAISKRIRMVTVISNPHLFCLCPYLEVQNIMKIEQKRNLKEIRCKLT